MTSIICIKLKDFTDSKEALVFATSDSGDLHISWETIDGKVISFEYIPENYPEASIAVWETKREYYDGIKDCSWIMEHVDSDTIKLLTTKMVEMECKECGKVFYIEASHSGAITCPYCGELVEYA